MNSVIMTPDERNKEINCSACHVKFDSVVNYKSHIGSEFHIFNTKRRMAELPPVSEIIFEEKQAQMISAEASAFSEVVFKCLPCNKTFKSIEQLDEHTKSKKHKKNEKEQKKFNPEMDDSTMF